MELNWIHDRVEGSLTCTINENLFYVTRDGGKRFKKTYNGEVTKILDRESWENEKRWLSDNFGHIFGKYSPTDTQSASEWVKENPNYTGALPVFGLSKSGEYLDRMCRPSSLQEGFDMHTVYKEGKIWIEVDSENNYWKREYCEEQDVFYNIQPCCVFPYNPGRTAMNKLQVLKYTDIGDNDE